MKFFRERKNLKHHMIILRKFPLNSSWSVMTKAIMEGLAGNKLPIECLRAVNCVQNENHCDIAIKLSDKNSIQMVEEKVVRAIDGKFFCSIKNSTNEIILPDFNSKEGRQLVIPTEKIELLNGKDFHYAKLINIKLTNKWQNLLEFTQVLDACLLLAANSTWGSCLFAPSINLTKGYVYIGFSDMQVATVLTNHMTNVLNLPFEYINTQNIVGNWDMMKIVKPKRNIKEKRLVRMNQAQLHVNNPLMAMAQMFASVLCQTKEISRDKSLVPVYASKEKAISRIFAANVSHKSSQLKFSDAPRLIDEMNLLEMPNAFRYESDHPTIKNFCAIVASGEYDVQFHKKSSDTTKPTPAILEKVSKSSSHARGSRNKPADAMDI